MKRNTILILMALVLVAAMVAPAFAAENAADAKAWFDQKFAAKKTFVEQAVKDGRMTAEQGEALQQHFDEMYKYHEQNGFVCPGQGFMGKMGGMGHGHGMMWRGAQPAN